MSKTKEQDNFLVGVERRYHLKFSDRYERLSKLSSVVALVSAIIVGATSLNQIDNLEGFLDHIPLGSSLIVTLISSWSIVFGWTHQSTKHRRLYMRYTDIARRMREEGDETNLYKELYDIEAESNCTKTIDFMMCYNDEARFRGSNYRFGVNFCQRLFSPLIQLFAQKTLDAGPKPKLEQNDTLQ